MKTISALLILLWSIMATAQVSLITKEIVDIPSIWTSNLTHILPIIPDQNHEGIFQIVEEHSRSPETDGGERRLIAKVVESFDDKGRLVSRIEQQIGKHGWKYQLEYQLRYDGDVIIQTISLERSGRATYNYGTYKIFRKEIPDFGTYFEIYDAKADQAKSAGNFEQQLLSGKIGEKALLFHDIDTNVLVVPLYADLHPGLSATMLRMDFDNVGDIIKGDFIYQPEKDSDHFKLKQCRIYTKPEWDDMLEINEYQYYSNRLGVGSPLYSLTYDTKRKVFTRSKTNLGGFELYYAYYQYDGQGNWISRLTETRGSSAFARYLLKVERKITYR